jgi:hypothetical protein
MNALRALVAGLVATLAMDLGAGAGRRAHLLQGVPLEWIQRWFALALRGRPFIADIRADGLPALPLPLVLAVHYSIGVTLATIYLFIVGSRGNLSTAIAFGLLTCALPWLFMFPGMGIGAFGLRAPAEALLLRTSLVNHLVYGVALGLLLRAWPPGGASPP